MKFSIALFLSVVSLNAFSATAKDVCEAFKKDFLKNDQFTYAELSGKNLKGEVCAVHINVYEKKCDLWIDPSHQGRAYINISQYQGETVLDIKRFKVDEKGIRLLEVSSKWKEQDRYGDLKNTYGSLSMKRITNSVTFKAKVRSSIPNINGNVNCKVELN